jgi:Sulfotransferase domain
LRNPVDRAISHYYHEVKLGSETLSLENAIAQEPERLQGEIEKLETDPNYYSYNHQHYTYQSRGLYLEQLQRWMAFFPKDQFLILKSEDFWEKPDRFLAEVLEFLQLPPLQLDTYPGYNAGNYTEIDPSLKQKLSQYFQEPNQQLSAFLQRDLNW